MANDLLIRKHVLRFASQASAGRKERLVRRRGEEVVISPPLLDDRQGTVRPVLFLACGQHAFHVGRRLLCLSTSYTISQ